MYVQSIPLQPAAPAWMPRVSARSLGAVTAAREIWHNKCGGPRWRTLSDGRIEVEGRGVPRFDAGSPAHHLVGKTWQNWETEFRKAGNEFGIPPGMLGAIAYCEVGFLADNPEAQRTVESPDGFGSIGIMQPIPSTTRAFGFTVESRYDPLQNIRLGAKIAKKSAEKYGLDFPAIAAAHNAGNFRCQKCPVKDCNPGPNPWRVHTYGNYLGSAIPAYNTLIEDFGAGYTTGGAWKFAMVGGALGLGLGWAVSYLRQ